MCALRLAEATRTGLPAMAAALHELWQAKQLREDEVGGGLGGLARVLQQGKACSWLILAVSSSPRSNLMYTLTSSLPPIATLLQLLELEELLRHAQQLCLVDPLSGKCWLFVVGTQAQGVMRLVLVALLGLAAGSQPSQHCRPAHLPHLSPALSLACLPCSRARLSYRGHLPAAAAGAGPRGAAPGQAPLRHQRRPAGDGAAHTRAAHRCGRHGERCSTDSLEGGSE